jgi:hypothetical protein
MDLLSAQLVYEPKDASGYGSFAAGLCAGEGAFADRILQDDAVKFWNVHLE